jgi:hypothetical protein
VPRSRPCQHQVVVAALKPGSTGPQAAPVEPSIELFALDSSDPCRISGDMKVVADCGIWR